MHTRNFNFSKIFTRSLWEKFLEEIVSEGENRMINDKGKYHDWRNGND